MREYKTSGYQHRHYEDIARILGSTEADDAVTAAFLRLFTRDNSRFDSRRFLAAVQKGRETE